jgi:hypothetical protein
MDLHAFGILPCQHDWGKWAISSERRNYFVMKTDKQRVTITGNILVDTAIRYCHLCNETETAHPSVVEGKPNA